MTTDTKTKARVLLDEAERLGIQGAEPLALYVLSGLDLLGPGLGRARYLRLRELATMNKAARDKATSAKG